VVKFFDLGRIGSIFLLLVSSQVSQLWFGFGLGKFLLKIPIFPSGHKKSPRFVGSKITHVKDSLASYLPVVKSMLGLGHGPSLI